MDKSKALDKIKKCLALSKSSNPYEAAAALRQAQKIMHAHDITERELGAVGYNSEQVSVAMRASNKVPLTLGFLTTIIMEAFGVDAVLGSELKPGNSTVTYTVRYFGPENRVMLAAYSHQVCYRAMESAWREQLLELPPLKGERGTRAAFQIGWLRSVKEQIEALAMTPEEEAGTSLIKQMYYGSNELRETVPNKLNISSGIVALGEEVGAGFRLHTPVAAENLKLGTA